MTLPEFEIIIPELTTIQIVMLTGGVVFIILSLIVDRYLRYRGLEEFN